MELKIIRLTRLDGEWHKIGDEITVPDSVGRSLIQMKKAELIKKPKSAAKPGGSPAGTSGA